MEEFELVVAEGYKFEYRAKWRNLALLDFSYSHESDAKNTTRQIHDQKNLYQSELFDADRDGRVKVCDFGEIWVWGSRKTIVKRFSVECSDYQGSDARNKINDF